MVIELPSHGQESVANRGVRILVRPVLVGGAIDDDSAVRNAELDAHAIAPSLVVTSAGGVDDDAATNDPVEKAVEPGHPLVHRDLERRARRYLAKRYLKRGVHVRGPDRARGCFMLEESPLEDNSTIVKRP